jgi:hypothetical protein
MNTEQNYTARIMGVMYASANIDPQDTEAKKDYLMRITGNRAKELVWAKSLRGKSEDIVPMLEDLAMDGIKRNLTQGQRDRLLVASFRTSKPDTREDIVSIVGEALGRAHAYVPKGYDAPTGTGIFAYQPL